MAEESPAPYVRPRSAIALGRPAEPVDIVIPVYNEEKDLENCIRRLHDYIKDELPYAVRISIADNASTDSTPQIAERLAREFPEVHSFRLPEKGRGRALRTVWQQSPSPVLAYMDVDLSTDLAALVPAALPRCSADTRTYPSAPGWPTVRTSNAAQSARSSPAATT